METSKNIKAMEQLNDVPIVKIKADNACFKKNCKTNRKKICLILSVQITLGLAMAACLAYYNLKTTKLVRSCNSSRFVEKPYNAEKMESFRFFHVQEQTQDGGVRKIDVIKVRDDCTRSFVHDFYLNITAIVDPKTCFIMPINRKFMDLPKSDADLFIKIFTGYYKINSNTLRRTMQVVVAPIEDLTLVGKYVAEECKGKLILMLKKYDRLLKKISTGKDLASMKTTLT
ncbi:unnamed protein product [Brassicogethes aeneus]|uniref:Integral membrane protein 2 n=1 Tax=Brassicogethes aeneus TaxID=1431903 RepID=A0A9P0AU18_BRAAE|nr:unnamed protein product [Brassicogethes aeneus]